MSGRKFSVGDRVRVISGRVINGPPMIGLETIIVSELVLIDGYLVHRLNERGNVYAMPETLALIYDGQEKVSWSECAWQPQGVRA